MDPLNPKVVLTQSTTDYYHSNTRIIVSAHYQGKTKRVYAVFPDSFCISDPAWVMETIKKLVAELQVRLGV